MTLRRVEGPWASSGTLFPLRVTAVQRRRQRRLALCSVQAQMRGMHAARHTAPGHIAGPPCVIYPVRGQHVHRMNTGVRSVVVKRNHIQPLT
jgi:hypothetical protein